MSCIRVKPVLRQSLRPTPRPIICCHTCNSADAHSSSLNQIQYAGTIPTSRSEVLGYTPFQKFPYRECIKGWFVLFFSFLVVVVVEVGINVLYPNQAGSRTEP